MIRFILMRHTVDMNSGEDRKDYETREYYLPELERLLESGVRGEMGFESVQLLGAEIVYDPDSQ